VLLPGDPCARAWRAAGSSAATTSRGLLGYTGRGNDRLANDARRASAAIVEELAMLGAQTVIRIGTCSACRRSGRDLIIATLLPHRARAALSAGDPSRAACSASSARWWKRRNECGAPPYRPHCDRDAFTRSPQWRGVEGARRAGTGDGASAIHGRGVLRGLGGGLPLTVSNAAGQHECLRDDDLLQQSTG
jgi:hypothetical protein